MPAMRCPNCQIEMQEVIRQEVQFEVCSNCRGVWLDRGELEKLVSSFQEVGQEGYAPKENAPVMSANEERYPKREYKREHYNDPDRYHRFSSGPTKKSVFERLEEIFQ